MLLICRLLGPTDSSEWLAYLPRTRQAVQLQRQHNDRVACAQKSDQHDAVRTEEDVFDFATVAAKVSSS
jgi:hypothetical protein